MKIVSYPRVSTKRQGESGLGLDAQREAIMQYAYKNDGTILAEFTEIESGKRSDRPQLAKALAMCKATGATLVVAKLDRLSRNVAFLSALMESGVPFVACDNEHATPLTLHIRIAVAEEEARMISQRTKAALAQAKKRGVKLGGTNPACRNLNAEGQARGSKRGAAATRQASQAFRAAILPLAEELAATMGPGAVAKALNEKGYTTRRGLAFTEYTVLNLLRKDRA